LNDFLQWLLHTDPVWVYCFIFLFAFIENLFPPSPSDTLIVFAGALAGMEKGNFFLALLTATSGSLLGFMTMFAIGRWFGNSILEKKKIPFISREMIHRIEAWFTRYGYWLIVANRFLTGTRAVISFVAGMSNLAFGRTTLLSGISALAWNAILVYAGYSLGSHWEDIGSYLRTYSTIVTIVVVAVCAAAAVHYFVSRRRRRA
jgi:membrane protein DedA with SNARE-associated domain